MANESFSKLESFGKLAFSKWILEGCPLASRVCRVWWRRTQLPGSGPLPSTPAPHRRDLQVPQRLQGDVMSGDVGKPGCLQGGLRSDPMRSNSATHEMDLEVIYG